MISKYAINMLFWFFSVKQFGPNDGDKNVTISVYRWVLLALFRQKHKRLVIFPYIWPLARCHEVCYSNQNISSQKVAVRKKKIQAGAELCQAKHSLS